MEVETLTRLAFWSEARFIEEGIGIISFGFYVNAEEVMQHEVLAF